MSTSPAAPLPEKGWEKEAESDDPFELHGMALPEGDPVFMVRCIVEEYARIGTREAEILRLFEDPAYHTHQVFLQLGSDRIRALVRETIAGTGILRAEVGSEGDPCPAAELIHHIRSQAPKGPR